MWQKNTKLLLAVYLVKDFLICCEIHVQYIGNVVFKDPRQALMKFRIEWFQVT